VGNRDILRLRQRSLGFFGKFIRVHWKPSGLIIFDYYYRNWQFNQYHQKRRGGAVRRLPEIISNLLSIYEYYGIFLHIAVNSPGYAAPTSGDVRRTPAVSGFS
jgi:hypothetical protein